MLNKISEIVIKSLEEYNPEIIYIFGSYASGEIHSESDVDIAFFSYEKKSAYDLFLKSQELSIELKKEVDLIELLTTTTILQNQVVRKGVVIYEKNRKIRDEFEVLVLKKYIELNEYRKKMIEEYEIKF